MANNTAIRIPSGTIVARLDIKGGNGRTVKLVGDVEVMATRDPDGSWRYKVGKLTYICAGGCAEVVDR